MIGTLRIKNLSFCSVVVFAILGCSRENNSSSKLIIKTPSQGSLLAKFKMDQFANDQSEKSKSFSQSLSLSDHKVCYSANVTGPGIIQQSSSCGPDKGVFTGFVNEGDTLSVTVPSGSSRRISIYSYITPKTNEVCPQWNFDCTKGQECQVYKVGESASIDISGPEITVSVDIQFPGFDKNIVVNSSSPKICTGEVKNQLYSNGEVRDAEGFSISSTISHPTLEGLFKINEDLFSVSSLNLVIQKPLFKMPPYLHSITADPSTGKIYGLSSSGRILEVQPTTGVITTFSDTNCPLSECRVPRWFQSVSIGVASQVFGLDHGGNIWKLDKAGVLKETPNKVGRNVQQVILY